MRDVGGSGCQVAGRGKSRFRRRSLVIFVYDVYVRRLWADAHSAFPAASLTSSRAFLKRCHSLQPASTPSFVATLIERERGLLISQTTSSQHRCSSLPFVASSFPRFSSEWKRFLERKRERGGGNYFESAAEAASFCSWWSRGIARAWLK